MVGEELTGCAALNASAPTGCGVAAHGSKLGPEIGRQLHRTQPNSCLRSLGIGGGYRRAGCSVFWARNCRVLAETVPAFRNTRGISSLADTLSTDVAKIFNATWSIRDGQVVPKTDDVVLANGAVKLHVVVLYADLARSTQLAMKFDRSVAAKIVRAYLSSMTRLVNSSGGVVRSFDGDRVMGVFIGDSKNSNAAECALKMNHLVTKILRPKAEAKFPSLVSKGFKIKHCVGISRSDVLVVRGGVRGSNDLVFVGAAPNIAAKLSEIRNSTWHSYITKSVYTRLNHDAKFSSKGENMWTAVTREIAGESWSLYKSSWRREP